MPTLKELADMRVNQIHQYRIFWEKVGVLHRTATDFIKTHDVAPKSDEMNKVILHALDRLHDEIINVVDQT